jgi:hypothetical protein
MIAAEDLCRELGISIKPKQDKPAASNKSRAGDFDDMISF